MTDIAIRVENLGKLYRIGGKQERYKTLRESIMGAVTGPIHRLRAAFSKSEIRNPKSEIIWALKDVSFEVQRGEVVGIIGRNGAGKTTLLKILSLITEPTEGYAEIHGRVGSLLEVGTGFHPELTGRENIYLNGAILGMKRAEIERKFDEIVDFAEIEKFIDTPVKRYSSGMYVRLAFAVAAHLEPEILLVDEVLAVGDAAFQKKCLGKMGDVAREGRTVLFVSHNMSAISQLCYRAMLLVKGETAFDGPASQAVSQYLSIDRVGENHRVFTDDPAKPMQIAAVAVETVTGELFNRANYTDPFVIVIRYRARQWSVGAFVCMEITNESGVRVLWASDVKTSDEMLIKRQPGEYLGRVKVPGGILAPGNYYCSVAIYAPPRPQAFDYQENVVSFEIGDGGVLITQFGMRHPAVTVIPLAWSTELVSKADA